MFKLILFIVDFLLCFCDILKYEKIIFLIFLKLCLVIQKYEKKILRKMIFSYLFLP